MTHISLPSERYVLSYLYIISTILPYIIDIYQQPSLCLKYSFLRCNFYSGSNVPWGGGKRHGGQKAWGAKDRGAKGRGAKGMGGKRSGGKRLGGKRPGGKRPGGKRPGGKSPRTMRVSVGDVGVLKYVDVAGEVSG